MDETREDDAAAQDEANAGPVGDLIRRFAALGLSGFFSTEGALRKAFGETVPQEWVDFVNEQGDRGRQEFFDRLAAEMGRVLEGMDVERLIDDLVTDRDIEIEATVRIRPRTTRTGDAKRSVSVRSGAARTTKRDDASR